MKVKTLEETMVDQGIALLTAVLETTTDDSKLANYTEKIFAALAEVVDLTIAEGESPAYREMVHELTINYINNTPAIYPDVLDIIKTNGEIFPMIRSYLKFQT